MRLTKSDILQIPHLHVSGFDRARGFICTGVSTDSRTVKRGDLFFAIRGEKFDGHDFFTKAAEAGAAALVGEKRWAENNERLLQSLTLPWLLVESTVHALGHLARFYRRRFKLPILIVGGSNGKTTTKDMIAAVLDSKYRVLSTEGNLNNHIGVPQTLFSLQRKHQIAVIEVGTNHFGEIAYLCSVIEPTHALITNIGREHLEFFGSLDGVARAEGEAFEWLQEHGSKKGAAFVNADDPRVVALSRRLRKVVRFGMASRAAEVKGRVLGLNDRACARLRIKARGGRSFDVELAVPGEHNAQNAVAAAAVGILFKVPAVRIQRALADFTGAGKRMQLIPIRGITILDDTYNANPGSVAAALQTLHAAQTKGKRIAVLADMLELGERAAEEHRRVGMLAAKLGIEYLLTYGPLSRHTHDAANVKFKAHYDQKNVLSEYIAELVADGDIVLVKGSRGMKMEDVVAFLAERLKEAA